MKQVLFMSVLVAGMLLTGCSKESENNGMEFTISENLVSLLAHDDYKITPSGAFTAQSSNEDVATVNADGVIHAVSAGDADIIFTSVENPTLEQTCKVSVDWRYKYFEEPILDFNMSLQEVKERETHPWVSENLWDAAYSGFPEATNPFLVRFFCTNQEIPMRACYTFLDKDKKGVGVISLEMIKPDHSDLLKADQQLEERYGSPSNLGLRTVFFNKKANCYILHSGVYIHYRKKPFE